jgi:ribonuclease HII
MNTKNGKLIEKYNMMIRFEKPLWDKGATYVAGIDEAGRGPLAGPVVAAACVLSADRPILGLDDSKKLSPKKRDELYEQILLNCLDFQVIRIEHDEIDQINILEATKKAMRLCVDGLKQTPECLLIDAVEIHHNNIPIMPIIKGDSLSVSIAAASILAKVTRDRIMEEYDVTYPGYEFSKHKGYGTKAHYAAIEKIGLSPIHRRSFLKRIIGRVE